MTMYIGKEFSPNLSLQSEYNIGDINVTVLMDFNDILTYLPPAPNLITIVNPELNNFIILKYISFEDNGNNTTNIVLDETNNGLIDKYPSDVISFPSNSHVYRKWTNFDYLNLINEFNNKAPTNHASTRSIYGISSATNYGHAMSTSTLPKIAGTADVGSEETKFARGDHVHPVQISTAELTTARSIDGVLFNGALPINHYGVCSTSASTIDKIVSLSNFTLTTGSIISVKFIYTNTASNPTLNVNSTGGVPMYNGTARLTNDDLKNGELYTFIYDGNNYLLSLGSSRNTGGDSAGWGN